MKGETEDLSVNESHRSEASEMTPPTSAFNFPNSVSLDGSQ